MRPGETLRAAAFIDRDGTLVAKRDYLADPEGVELVPGAAAALRRLRRAGYALVVVTNQSGIARGLYTPADYEAVRRRIDAVLAAEGVRLDGVYHCPHHPDLSGPCDCRKPGVGLYRRAAAQLGLDLGRSLYIGDRLKDVEPAEVLGGRAFLVRTGYGEGEAPAAPLGVRVVADLGEAAEAALAEPPASQGTD